MSGDGQKHLDFDLDFLDEKTEESSKRKKKKEIPSKEKSPVFKNATGWKIAGGVVAFILLTVWIGSLGTDNSSTASRNPSTGTANTGVNLNPDDTVVVGEFRCSQYHYNQITDLEPAESKRQLSLEQTMLEQEAEEVENLASQIENSGVTEYSPQYKIDEYNRLIERYNSKLTAYQGKANRLDERIDRFNRQVRTYNDYLVENCEPIEQ